MGVFNLEHRSVGKPRLGVDETGAKVMRDVKHLQDYEKIKADCKASGQPWKDPDFACADESVFYSRRPPKPFIWKRPSEIVHQPYFIKHGFGRFDVKQGKLGDCWLLAAVASLTMHRDLFENVVIPGQEFNQDYYGVFRFRFWQFGQWVEVCIDDRLPTFEDRLVFLRSSENDEFWSALLEKAYAKLYGSYESLKGGSTGEAMEDFTGGLSEMFDLTKRSKFVIPFTDLEKAVEERALISCALDADPKMHEARLPNGLVRGHSYSITGATTVSTTLAESKYAKIPLLRLRNPWGNAVEWNGPWSDQSEQWNSMSDEARHAMGLNFDADGEFWMSYHDFLKIFEKLEICHPDITTLKSLPNHRSTASPCRSWEVKSLNGEWTAGVSAGGCRNYLSTFALNPQYQIALVDPDETDQEKLCTCIVALMQKNRRRLLMTDERYLTIGFALYKVIDPYLYDKHLGTSFFCARRSLPGSQFFINLREVCCRFRLLPGRYVVVPSTFKPNEEAQFMLRIFTEKTCNVCCLGEECQLNPAMPIIDEETDEAMSKVKRRLEKMDIEFSDLSAKDLMDILNSAAEDIGYEQFTLSQCQNIFTMLTTGGDSEINVEKIVDLWHVIKLWKKELSAEMIKRAIPSLELKELLAKFGYRLSAEMLKIIIHKYSVDNLISFGDLVVVLSKLKFINEFFEKQRLPTKDTAEFNSDEFICFALSV